MRRVPSVCRLVAVVLAPAIAQHFQHNRSAAVAISVCTAPSAAAYLGATLLDMQRDAIDRLLSAPDVAQMLGVSRRTFESIVAKRMAPIFILVGRQRRWRQSDVHDWIAELAETAKRERERDDNGDEEVRKQR